MSLYGGRANERVDGAWTVRGASAGALPWNSQTLTHSRPLALSPSRHLLRRCWDHSCRCCQNPGLSPLLRPIDSAIASSATSTRNAASNQSLPGCQLTSLPAASRPASLLPANLCPSALVEQQSPSTGRRQHVWPTRLAAVVSSPVLVVARSPSKTGQEMCKRGWAPWRRGWPPLHRHRRWPLVVMQAVHKEPTASCCLEWPQPRTKQRKGPSRLRRTSRRGRWGAASFALPTSVPLPLCCVARGGWRKRAIHSERALSDAASQSHEAGVGSGSPLGAICRLHRLSDVSSLSSTFFSQLFS